MEAELISYSNRLIEAINLLILNREKIKKFNLAFDSYASGNLKDPRMLIKNLSTPVCSKIDRTYNSYCKEFKRICYPKKELLVQNVDRTLRDYFFIIQAFLEDFYDYSALMFNYSNPSNPDRIDTAGFRDWVTGDKEYGKFYGVVRNSYIIRNKIVHDHPSMFGLAGIRIAYLIYSFSNNVMFNANNFNKLKELLKRYHGDVKKSNSFS